MEARSVPFEIGVGVSGPPQAVMLSFLARLEARRMVKGRLAVLGVVAASLRRTVTSKGPLPEAVPEIKPVEGSRANPCGRAPPELHQARGGRPRGGKRNSLTAAVSARLYPRWKDFHDLRMSLDPEERMLNPYLKKILAS